ncbi:MAG: carbamate kinase [Lachnospiraceae bacterium]|nr:carbamate kinase [Lachnospiraceae bacterium]
MSASECERRKKKRIVVALGGNALGNTLPEQMKAVKITSRSIVDLIEDGNEVVITHGNGPQVGMINNAMAALSREDPNQPNTPLSVCVAMSQAYIGYDLQNAMREELKNRGMEIPVTTMITQVRVLEEDPAFAHPNKPIGHFMSKEQAEHAAEKYGYIMAEDAGRGYRRMVASPKPYEIVEIEAIKTLVGADDVVIACGGGGIPVALRGNHLKGQSAVIDKDFVSAKLAKDLDADLLIILTAVEKVCLHFGKPDEKQLDKITVEEAKTYIENGEFAAGSMLPKIEAAMDFASSKPGRKALITLLEKAKDGIEGRTGTVILRG